MYNLTFAFTLVCCALSFSACQEEKKEEASREKTMYLATGLCPLNTGITYPTAGSNLVLKINSNGTRDVIMADYNAHPANPGDVPVGVGPWLDKQIIALIRPSPTTIPPRIEILDQTLQRPTIGIGGTITTSATLTALHVSPDFSMYLARAGIVEKFTKDGVRVGATSHAPVNATCGGANNSNIVSMVTTPTQRLIFTNSHTAAPRVVVMAAAGTTCKSAKAPPAAGMVPTALAFDEIASKLFVAYVGAAQASNTIYSYDFDDEAGTLSNPQKIYDLSLYPATYGYALYGITAMAVDPELRNLFVATGASATSVTNFNVEKFSYRPELIGTDNPNVLTRSQNPPFYPYGIDTRCISQIFLR